MTGRFLEALVSAVVGAASALSAGAAQALPRETVACAFHGPANWRERSADAGPGKPTFGPCTAAEGIGVLPPADAFPAVFLANFGLLSEVSESSSITSDAGTGRHRYDFVCEETFGGLVPRRIARHPDGRLFVVGFDGLYVAPALGCGYARSGGSISSAFVVEVALDRTNPQRVFAFSRLPDALHASNDGGATFETVAQLAPDVRFERLVVVPATGASANADPAVIYLAGYTRGHLLVLLRSSDGGRNFQIDRFVAAVFGGEGTRARAATLLEANLTDGNVETLYLAVGFDSSPDEIWRSLDAGQSWTKALTLAGTEVQVGFATTGRGRTIYVAGTEPFPTSGGDNAHLYQSSDGGASFGSPLASRTAGGAGPTYRCLSADDAGHLYACGDPSAGEFLFGVSGDGGRTWSGIGTVADINGPRACTNGRCAMTASWLCTTYGACQGLSTPEPSSLMDAGGPDSLGQRPGSDQPGTRTDGCGCHVGGATSKAPAPAALVVFGLVYAMARVRARRNGLR